MHRINVKWYHHGGTVDRGRRTVLIGAIAVLTTIAGSSGVSAHAATTTGVLTGSGDTWDPSAGIDASTGDTFLAWTLYTRGSPHAFLRVNSDPKLLLNRRGLGWAWSIDAANPDGCLPAGPTR